LRGRPIVTQYSSDSKQSSGETINRVRNESHKATLAGSFMVFLIILSLRDYFLFVPFKEGFNFLAFMGFLTILGWILILIVPPIVILSSKEGHWAAWKTYTLIVSSTFWTISTLIIKIYGLLAFGQLWTGYWIAHPIMLFLEFLLPAYYIWLAVRFQRNVKISL
jgi:hypothetical protein